MQNYNIYKENNAQLIQANMEQKTMLGKQIAENLRLESQLLHCRTELRRLKILVMEVIGSNSFGYNRLVTEMQSTGNVQMNENADSTPKLQSRSNNFIQAAASPQPGPSREAIREPPNVSTENKWEPPLLQDLLNSFEATEDNLEIQGERSFPVPKANLSPLVDDEDEDGFDEEINENNVEELKQVNQTNHSFRGRLSTIFEHNESEITTRRITRLHNSEKENSPINKLISKSTISVSNLSASINNTSTENTSITMLGSAADWSARSSSHISGLIRATRKTIKDKMTTASTSNALLKDITNNSQSNIPSRSLASSSFGSPVPNNSSITDLTLMAGAISSTPIVQPLRSVSKSGDSSSMQQPSVAPKIKIEQRTPKSRPSLLSIAENSTNPSDSTTLSGRPKRKATSAHTLKEPSLLTKMRRPADKDKKTSSEKKLKKK